MERRDGWRVVRYAPDGTVDRVVEMPVQAADQLHVRRWRSEHTLCDLGESRPRPDQITRQPDAGGLFAIETETRGIPETRFDSRFMV